MRGVEAAAAEDDFAVEAVAEVVRGVGFDDAAHFAAVFGGEIGGEDAERADVVGFDFGAEAGGAIVWRGMPSTTIWVWYSEPRGWRTALPS